MIMIASVFIFSGTV